jgi:hypothetical protein
MNNGLLQLKGEKNTIQKRFLSAKAREKTHKCHHIHPPKSPPLPGLYLQYIQCHVNTVKHAIAKLSLQALTRDGIFILLRSPGIDSTSLCSQGGRYHNPIPTRSLARHRLF